MYFGTRGDDAEGLGDVPEFGAAVSLIGAHRPRVGLESWALEDLTGERVDLDRYEIDDHLDQPEVVQLRRTMLRILSKPSVVVTYRPSTFLSAICFARQDLCEYAGMFRDHQAAFEHKPWVESTVRSMGIDTIPWTYLADEEQLDALEHLADGPVVLRTSRSSGGTGLVRIDCAEQLASAWPEQAEAFVSVAPYIGEGVPVNVSGVVWRNGITLHGLSLQLTGVPELTDRPFGYCGNDFGAAKELDRQLVDEIERATVRVGARLGSYGYRGAFGIDFLVTDDGPLFTEVNPRLQGVTHLACQESIDRNESCVLLEHLAANLDLEAPRVTRPLHDQVASARDASHLVFHATTSGGSVAEGEAIADAALEWPRVRRVDVVCKGSVRAAEGATMARTTVDGRVTRSAFELLEPWRTEATSVTLGGRS